MRGARDRQGARTIWTCCARCWLPQAARPAAGDSERCARNGGCPAGPPSRSHSLPRLLVLRPEPARQFESVGTRVFEPVELGLSGLIGQFEEIGGTIQKIGELARQNRRLS